MDEKRELSLSHEEVITMLVDHPKIKKVLGPITPDNVNSLKLIVLTRNANAEIRMAKISIVHNHCDPSQDHKKETKDE